jgi:hypothetical protein
MKSHFVGDGGGGGGDDDADAGCGKHLIHPPEPSGNPDNRDIWK